MESSSSTLSSPTTTPSSSRSSSTSSAPSSVFPAQQRLSWHKPRIAATTTATSAVAQYLALIASYLGIGILTVFAITCLFCFFLAIRLLDDMFRAVVPQRVWAIVRSRVINVDWAELLGRISLRMARLAEWEKSRRASLYPSFSERFANIDGDGLHAFLFSLNGFLSNYRRKSH